jgi:hypothetical protein
MLCKRFVVVSVSPVNGFVLCLSTNHFSISVRTYVCPSSVNTGFLITSVVNGHWKESKTKETTVPTVTDSARDMLSVGDDTGTSSVSCAEGGHDR